MLNFDKFKEYAKRALSIQSTAETGNEELVRYLQSLMHDYGFKTQMQQVNHSVEGLSKRQCNLIGYTGDSLVDRTSRRGVLFVNPLDVTTGNLPQLWTSTQGNPYAPVLNEQGIVGAGAIQGKLDFLCRIFAAIELLDKRHKQPVYLVGTCASHVGMMGSRFLIESLAVNPKEVYSFAPTALKMNRQAAGQGSFTIELESANRDRDSRGYNRSVEITSHGLSVDYSAHESGTNSFDLLMDLILEAAEKGFDFQWAALESKAPSGTNPDYSRAQIYLTAFQFEDFKQFLKTKLNSEEQQKRFRIEFGGITEGGTNFISSDLIEVILELDYEWKKFVENLNLKTNSAFLYPKSVGALAKIQTKNIGKIAITFEIRFLPDHQATEIEEKWRACVLSISSKHARFHFSVVKDYLVPGVRVDEAVGIKNTNYLSDAGWFHKSKFPVTLMGVGSTESLPKGPNEAVLWKDLENAIQVYQDLMISVSHQ